MAVKLFCYRKGNTLLHKVPALIKIIFMVVFCITAFLGGQMETVEEILVKPVFFQLLYCICVCILLFLLGKGRLSDVIQMKWILWFGLLVTVFRLIPEDEEMYRSWASYKPVFLNGILAGGLYTIRFFFASFACQMIFTTTSGLEIREAFENVHVAVCKILPFMKNFNLAFAVSLAVTFIPEVFETWNRVQLASKARRGNRKSFAVFFRVLFSELSALLSVMISKADIKHKAILNRGYRL